VCRSVSAQLVGDLTKALNAQVRIICLIRLWPLDNWAKTYFITSKRADGLSIGWDKARALKKLQQQPAPGVPLVVWGESNKV